MFSKELEEERWKHIFKVVFFQKLLETRIYKKQEEGDLRI